MDHSSNDETGHVRGQTNTPPSTTRRAKKLGPEYLALIDAIKDVDPDSTDGQEIESMFAMLDQSCPYN